MQVCAKTIRNAATAITTATARHPALVLDGGGASVLVVVTLMVALGPRMMSREGVDMSTV